MPYNKCPICELEANIPRGDGVWLVECPNCQPFIISEAAYEDYPGRRCPAQKAAILSHAVFKMHDRDERPYLDNNTIDALLESGKPPGQGEDQPQWRVGAVRRRGAAGAG